MIGKKVWMFDINRRRYTKPAPGQIWGDLIWREHWAERTITGETRMSWLTKHGEKIPKKQRDLRKWAFSQAEIDDQEWLHEHRYQVAQRVQRLTDATMLKAVADLIGYVP